MADLFLAISLTGLWVSFVLYSHRLDKVLKILEALGKPDPDEV